MRNTRHSSPVLRLHMHDCSEVWMSWWEIMALYQLVCSLRQKRRTKLDWSFTHTLINWCSWPPVQICKLAQITCGCTLSVRPCIGLSCACYRTSWTEVPNQYTQKKWRQEFVQGNHCALPSMASIDHRSQSRCWWAGLSTPIWVLVLSCLADSSIFLIRMGICGKGVIFVNMM